MRNTSWVVYLMPTKDNPAGVRAVCQQGEWEAMDRARPGFFTLVQGGIANEGEAEQLARGTAGETQSRTGKAVPVSGPQRAAGVLAGPDTAAG
jgi:hypothetical protein